MAGTLFDLESECYWDPPERTLANFPADQFINRDAEILGDNQEYRYRLRRWWDPRFDQVSWCVWIMLNPSTANGLVDDATIRRCMRFAWLWGHGGMIVVNLFAWRSRHPSDLLLPSIDPVGPENDRFIFAAARQSDRLVLGWGATQLATSRVAKLTTKLNNPMYPLPQCLGVTKAGEPRHPLMLAYATPLQPFTCVTAHLAKIHTT